MMEREIIFRNITPADVDTITRMRLMMLDEVTEDPLPAGLGENVRRFVWNQLMNGGCIGAVAEIGGEVVADAVIYLYDTMPDEVNLRGVTAILYNVYTLPEFRGRGIMAQLLPEVIQLAREAGAAEIQMLAERKAIPLYERMGFRVSDQMMKMDLE